ncbi:unnamed protein product [Tuber aestivum]|uniref:Uncharacterized protein n=1 Tax=Tuber aestivum TaxID=59557 RepID=A0A292Q7E5_9PEZI|nr:unnamed protein product [Tuber aestivum]
MQNLRNFHPTNGATQPVPRVSFSPLYPPGDPRTSELASIREGLDAERPLHPLMSRNPGYGASAQPEHPAPWHFRAQPAPGPSSSLPALSSLGVSVPFPVEDAIGTPSALPAHPGHLPSAPSSLLTASNLPQTNPCRAIAHLLHLIAEVLIESQNIPPGPGASPSTVARAAPLPCPLPNFLPGNAAPPRRYESDAVLRPRGGHGAERPWRVSKKKKSQKNDNDHPPSKNGGESRSKRGANCDVQGKGSQKNQAGDSREGNPSGRA